MEEDLQQIAHI